MLARLRRKLPGQRISGISRLHCLTWGVWGPNNHSSEVPVIRTICCSPHEEDFTHRIDINGIFGAPCPCRTSKVCPNFVHVQHLSYKCLSLVLRMSLTYFCPGIVSYFQLLSSICPLGDFQIYLLSNLCPILWWKLIKRLLDNLWTNFGMTYFFIYNLVTLHWDKNWTNLGY